jgi:hypothetical protein
MTRREMPLLVPALRTGLLAALLLVALLVPQPVQAQRFYAAPGDLPRIDTRTQAAIVDSVSAAVDSIYVIGDEAAQIISLWRSRLAEGAYRELTDPAEFVTRLESDAFSIRRDGHFGMRALFPVDPSQAQPAETPQQTERFQRAQRARNYGFSKVEMLPGGIGYLKLDQFPSTENAAETAIAAMNFLANSSALIIDLRENGGGSAAMIRLVASYLFAETAHLINWYQRATDETVQSHTYDYVPGRRLTDIPLYILSSDGTASAAEEFTFDMQNLKRATIVGDTTAGAGHTVASAMFDFKKFRVGMRIPFGRAYDPLTGAGWEGRGVIPDVAVPVEQALTVANAKALEGLREKETDPEGQQMLDWYLAGLKSQTHPLTLARAQLEEYVGVYGPRRVFLDGDILCAQREGRPMIRLRPMVRDLFAATERNDFRLRFDRDGQGRIVRVVGIYDDGQQDPLDRTQ